MTRRRTQFLSGVFAMLTIALPILHQARGDELPSVVLSGESRATFLRLSGVRKLLNERKWPEAIEELQRILNTAGNDLVSLTPTHSIQARRLCQIYLASLPPASLRLYRQRYESQARKKLEQSQAAHDIHQLRKVVDEAFCTRSAEKALNLLGDLAFERGRFDEAEEWWRLLSPLPDIHRDQATRGLTLVYPDPTLDPARIQAKQLLARLFRDPGDAWAHELDRYRTRHSKAEGTLAGRKGRYVDLLQTLADERKKEKTSTDRDWTTFGGEPSRGRVIPASDDVLDRLSALCRDGPTWRFCLQDRTRQEDPPPPSATNAAQARSLAFHPLIVGHQVLMADAQFVTAFDLRTGQSHEWYDVAPLNSGVKPNRKLPAPPDLRYTLTVADDNVYVRLGAQDLGMQLPPTVGPASKPRRDNETFLTCLSLRPDRLGDHVRWCIRGIAQDNALFEGAPLVEGGQIWIASSRYNGDRCITSIDCYPTDETSEPPLSWRRAVCETRELKPGEPRFRHQLLTLAGTQLVYCSHTGAVVAVDALTGRTNWAIRYPRWAADKGDVSPKDANPGKDLAPVLFADGRLYVAPADSDRLLCLDPATGRTLWEREAMKVVHLLGVGQKRLIFTTTDGLRAVGAADGNDATGWELPHANGKLPPAGRGLLIGDLVLWPTVLHDELSVKTNVLAVRQSDGRPADDPTLLHRLPAGNLAYANGCLAVADQHTLYVFVLPRLLLPERKDEVLRHPESIPALIKRGQAEADAGLTTRAIQTFLQTEEMIRRLPRSRSRQRLLDQTQTTRLYALLEAAERMAAAKRWEDTARILSEAFAVELSPRARLHALLKAVRIWQNAGQSGRVLAIWQTILADEALRQLQVIDKNGTPVFAADAAADALARLRQGDDEQRTTLARQTLRDLARKSEQAKHHGAAAQAYRRLLATGIKDDEEATALLGLARVYERQHCWNAAREVWQRLAREHGNRVLKELDANRAVRDFITDHLRSPPFAATSLASGGPSLPLFRSWHTTLGKDEWVLAGWEESDSELLLSGGFMPRRAGDISARREPPGADVSGSPEGFLLCRSTATGEVHWQRPLPFAPRWAGCHADTILACGERGVACLRRDDGNILWHFPAPASGLYPTSSESVRVIQDPQTPERLTTFRLASGRLFFLQGERRLFALDVEVGKILWNRWAPDARFNLPYPRSRFSACYYAGAQTVLVQTSGRRWLLDAATGRQIHQAPVGRDLWQRPPLLLNERTLCVISNPRHVVAFDTLTGQCQWTHELKGRTTLSGEVPQILGRGDLLLLVTPTNVGYLLQRLDRASGKSVWPRPCLLTMKMLNVSAWTFDQHVVYYADDRQLIARSLADGRVLWQRPLKGTTAWQVRKVRNYLAVYPLPSTEDGRFRLRASPWSVQWYLGPLLAPEAVFALACHDPKSGQLVQRLNFRINSPARTAYGRRRNQEDSGRFLVVRSSPLLASEDGPVVRLRASRRIVAVGGEVWGLTIHEEWRRKAMNR